MAEIVSFTRVSTQKQALHGESLAAQAARIESWAAQHQHTIIGSFSDDGYSGRSLHGRAGIQQAVALACRKRGRILCVTSLSRVARNVRHCLDIGDALRRSGACLVSLTESLNSSDANGRLVWSLLTAIHAWLAEVGAENTSYTLRDMARRNLRVSGRLPYGYQLDGDGRTLVPVEAEQAVIERIRSMRATGMSYARIAQALDGASILTQSGRSSWMPRVVAAIYARETARREPLVA